MANEATATKANATATPPRLIVIEQRVRDALGPDFKLKGDFMYGLHVEIERLVKRAAERAKGNGRNTLSARDL